MQIIIRQKNVPKKVFTVTFCNNGMEQINLNRIVKYDSFIIRLPGTIQLQKGILVATYRLTPTIRNKVLFHNETVQ